MPDYISIGKFVAVHGLKGDLVLKHALGRKTSLKGLKALFLEDGRDKYVPWFLEEAKARTEDEILVKLEDIQSPEAARKLNQKRVWLSKADFDRFASQSAAISYIGYQVVNEGKLLGEITSVNEQPHQVLCTVEIEGKEAYIPLHSETLVKVDRQQKEVHVVLPEGLLELYLD